MKNKFIKFYADIAARVAELSYAERLKVGAVAVKDDRIISYGYNGMPSGWDNICEHVFLDPEEETGQVLVTKAEALHAESNLIAKISKSGESSNGATLFITHAPCLECAKLIYQAGFREVFYTNSYRSKEGIKFLRTCNIQVQQIAK